MPRNQNPVPPRHICVNKAYLGKSKLPDIHNVTGISAAYKYQNHINVRTPCPASEMHQAPLWPEKKVKCATGFLPIPSVKERYKSIYQHLMDRWAQYQRDAECLANCKTKVNREHELNLRLAELKKQAETIADPQAPRSATQFTRFRRQMDSIQRSRREKLYCLKKPPLPHEPVRLRRGTCTKITDEERQVLDEAREKGEYVEVEKDRPPQRPVPRNDDALIQKVLSLQGFDWTPPNQKPPKPSKEMKAAMKKFQERKIRRPSWLPDPVKKKQRTAHHTKLFRPEVRPSFGPPGKLEDEEEEEFDPEHISPAVRKGFKQMFDYFDLNKDTVISQDELYEVMKALGFDLTWDDAKFIIGTIDQQGEGTIEVDDWIEYYASIDAFAEYLIPPTVENGKYHKKFITIMFSMLGEFLQKGVLSRANDRYLKDFYAERFAYATKNHPDLNYKVSPFRTARKIYGPSGGELRHRLEDLRLKAKDDGGDDDEDEDLDTKALKMLINPPLPRAPYPKWPESSGKTHLYPGTRDTLLERVEKDDKTLRKMRKANALDREQPFVFDMAMRMGRAREQLRLGRLNRFKKLVIIFRPFAKQKDMIRTKFTPFIMPWEKDKLNFKVDWKPRKSFEELSPQSSMNVRRAYSSVIKIRKDGTRIMLKPKIPKKEVDHTAWLFYQRYVSVTSRQYTYDLVIDLPDRYTRWSISKLYKLRDRLHVAAKRFNRSVAGKKKRQLIAHFAELFMCAMLSKKMYKRYKQVYCDYSSPEVTNESRVTTKWLDKACNCMKFRLKCAESAFYMRQ